MPYNRQRTHPTLSLHTRSRQTTTTTTTLTLSEYGRGTQQRGSRQLPAPRQTSAPSCSRRTSVALALISFSLSMCAHKRSAATSSLFPHITTIHLVYPCSAHLTVTARPVRRNQGVSPSAARGVCCCNNLGSQSGRPCTLRLPRPSTLPRSSTRAACQSTIPVAT